MKNTCPCCGYRTLDEIPPGTYEICEICFWEDDNIQFQKPHYVCGANGVSLFMAQRNFTAFGACDEASINAVRKPTDQDERDVNWHSIEYNR